MIMNQNFIGRRMSFSPRMRCRGERRVPQAYRLVAVLKLYLYLSDIQQKCVTRATARMLQ